jgi:hypothetical protein
MSDNICKWAAKTARYFADRSGLLCKTRTARVLSFLVRQKPCLSEKSVKLFTSDRKTVFSWKDKNSKIISNRKVILQIAIYFPTQASGVIPLNSRTVTTRKRKNNPIPLNPVRKDEQFRPIAAIFLSFPKNCLNQGRPGKPFCPAKT